MTLGHLCRESPLKFFRLCGNHLIHFLNQILPFKIWQQTFAAQYNHLIQSNDVENGQWILKCFQYVQEKQLAKAPLLRGVWGVFNKKCQK